MENGGPVHLRSPQGEGTGDRLGCWGFFLDIHNLVDDGFTAGREANHHLQRGNNLQSTQENRPDGALGSKSAEHLPNRDRP